MVCVCVCVCVCVLPLKEWFQNKGPLPFTNTTSVQHGSSKNSFASNHHKMYLSVLIFGLVVLPQVHTLRCQDCLEGVFGSCLSNAAVCPSGDFQCGATRTATYAGSTELADITVKSCVLPEYCGVISVNFGLAKTIVNTMCCNTDLCNNVTAPAIPVTSTNGKKCFTCNDRECSNTLNCEGNEDLCITASVIAGGSEQTVKGCGSRQLCAADSQMAATFGSNLKCCEGDLCNSASSTGAGLLLLMTSLSLVLFS